MFSVLSSAVFFEGSLVSGNVKRVSFLMVLLKFHRSFEFVALVILVASFVLHCFCFV